MYELGRFNMTLNKKNCRKCGGRTAVKTGNRKGEERGTRRVTEKVQGKGGNHSVGYHTPSTTEFFDGKKSTWRKRWG